MANQFDENEGSNFRERQIKLGEDEGYLVLPSTVSKPAHMPVWCSILSCFSH
jgi:hypothetical protein